jgi:hypothetical protein
MNLASGLELLPASFWQNPEAVADVIVMNVHKTPSRALSHKEVMGQTSS